MNSKQREKEIYKITITGGIANCILLIFKFVAGILAHSSAMIADAVHSLSDFVTDITVIIFAKISHKPKDDTHDYGHGKFETLATGIISIALFLVGIGIFWQGFKKIYDSFHGVALESPGMLAFWAAVISILIKETIYQYTSIKGKKINSEVVIANAWHHRSDAFSSIGTALGIGGAIFLGPKWKILDPIAAVVVSCFILGIAVKLMINCINELLEKSLPDEVENEIIDIVTSFDEVENAHDLRTRKIGNYIAIDMHILMDGDLSLRESHQCTIFIEDKLRKKFGEDTYISLHVEPADEEQITRQPQD